MKVKWLLCLGYPNFDTSKPNVTGEVPVPLFGIHMKSMVTPQLEFFF